MEQNITLETCIKDLEKAKENTQWLLDNPNGIADGHGLEYWAGRVERLRELIENSL